MTKSVQAFRWICVLPGALMCAFLVAFPIHWVVMLIQLTGGAEDSFITIDGKSLLAAIPPETLERFGQALLAPFVMVAGGATIAPSYRFRTGIVLTCLLAACLLVLHILADSWGFQFSGGWLQRLFTHALQVAGFTWGLFYAHGADKETRETEEIDDNVQMSWLTRRVSLDEAGLTGEMCDEWQAFANELQPGDELWEFCSPLDDYDENGGAAGLAIIRNGVVLTSIITVLS